MNMYEFCIFNVLASHQISSFLFFSPFFFWKNERGAKRIDEVKASGKSEYEGGKEGWRK